MTNNGVEKVDAVKAISNEGEKETRVEKRIQKALESFSYQKIIGINKISFNKTKNTIFIINNPDIFKSSVNNSYLIFGEAKIENNINFLKLKKQDNIQGISNN
nr:nascent polypeptide-associated complex subunit alpha-like protein 1 [Cryptomonas curvata]|mmetsp:Transcript_6104/g.13508  ORF Transcript_6104/g.13508 Transcript_6104/m.13508 type:complete len:103 (-) Transcript_6104:1325-1633(-)